VYSVDVVSGKRGPTLTSLDSPAALISFSPDAGSVAILSTAGNLTLWGLQENKVLAQLSGSTGARFIFSVDGALIAFDDGKDKVTILESRTGATRTSFASPPDAQLAVFLHDNTELFLAPKENAKSKWSVISVSTVDGKTLRTVDGDATDINDFTSRYYVDSQDDGMHLRDLTDWKEVRRIGGEMTLGGSRFSASGSKIAVAGNNQPKLLDAVTGAVLAKCPVPDDDDGLILAISSKEQWLAYGGASKAVRLCELKTGATIETFAGHEFSINAIAFSADDRQMLSGDNHGNVRLWDTATGKLLKAFKGNERDALVVAFSPDGKRLFAGTDDNKVRIWDAPSGRELRTLRMLLGPVHALAVSPDGRRVAAGPYGSLTIKQWDVETGKELKRLESDIGGRFTTTRDAEYSADGKSLVAIANNRIVIWDVDTGQQKLDLSAPDQELMRVSLSRDQSRIVSLDDGGVIRHWNRATGALLVTIVPSADGQWLRVTPEGFFDASPDAAKSLTVVRGLDVYSIDQFYNQLYRPDLVREKLAGDPQGKLRDAAARLDLTKAMASGRAPRVAITAPSIGTRVQGEQIRVDAEVFDQGGGIGKLEWRVNGVTLGIEERGLARTDQDAAPAGGIKSIKVDRALALTPGENRIAALAYNAAGLIASEAAEITVTSIQQAAQKPNLYVLAVGVNDYWDSALRLNFARADATSLGDALKQAGARLYQEVTVRTVLDGDATAEKLDAIFAELAQKVRPQDVFVFFLAGHGKTVDARFYFLPQDFRYSGEDSIVRKGVGQDQLQGWVSRIKAQKSVLLFDACQSGSLIGDRIAMRGIEEKAAIDRMTRAMGRTILTATTEDKPALEGYHGHGVFTYALLAGLDEADSDSNGVIDVTELAQYVDRRLPDLTYDVFKLRQVPQMSIVGSNFPLASRASVLSGGDQPAAPADIPARPTHVVIAPVDVKSDASQAANTTSQLAAGSQVVLMSSANGWTLIARDGHKLGYVRETALIKLQ
jgi:WD40 repeat protein